MSLQRYKYPCAVNGQSIRLLKITSSSKAIASGRTGHELAEHDGALCLQITQFSIGSEPPYRALSYTWGPPEENDTGNIESEITFVVLNGERHYVACNLFQAILQLRESYPDSYVWIDALCINQEDLEERRMQVAIMDKIYRNADETLVWLGQVNDSTERIFALVRQVASLDKTFFQLLGHEGSPNLLNSYGLPDKSDKIWRHYMDFFDRRWFYRGWVIQEVVLAKGATVHWGAFTMPWREVVAGSKIFLPERLRKFFFARFRGQIEHIDNLALGRNALRIGLIQEACLQNDFYYLLVVEICTGQASFATAGHILLHLMRMARDFSWTDPRDRVYSLIGLVNLTARLHGVPPLELMPDYSESKTAAAVLTEVATMIIEQSGCLGIISQVSDLSFRQIKGLSSWVPDFLRSPNFSMGRNPTFDACGHKSTTTRPMFRIDGPFLYVEGKCISIIQETLSLDHGNNLGHIIDILAMAYKSRLPRKQDRAEVLWRTMIWDVYGHGHKADDHPAPAFMADSFLSWIHDVVIKQTSHLSDADLSTLKNDMWRVVWPSDVVSGEAGKLSTTTKLKTVLGLTAHNNPISSQQYSGADAEIYTSHASGVTWCQHLMLLDKGYLGMGPKSTQPGDEVWAIPGCLFPMVLRPMGESYCVLGRAYVHGAMHGESLGETEAWEELCLR